MTGQDQDQLSTPHRAPEPIGKRIARLRVDCGWTQQALAARLGVSRVAVSHIEMDLTIPSERTITLLAGIFKLSPHELVEGTTYPRAKAERLPVTAFCYTKLEMELGLLENDLAWLERLDGTAELPQLVNAVQERWVAQLSKWDPHGLDDLEQGMLAKARNKLAKLCGDFPVKSRY
jgi:transcriptional regulator with XRE-family HTH domain